jgi:hypothetical protein
MMTFKELAALQLQFWLQQCAQWEFALINQQRSLINAIYCLELAPAALAWQTTLPCCQ